MKKVRLGDIATYINGYAFKPDDWDDKGRPIIRIQDLTGNVYQANRFAGSVPEKYNVIKGDVLISWSASLGVYVWNGEEAVLNQHIFKVVFDKETVNKEFFIHQVSGILKRAASEAHGATMKHLTKPVFDVLPFVLLDIEEQNRIAEILNKAQSVIDARKQQLSDFDMLIKARFVEMFGDPEFNEKQWNTIKLEELCMVSSSKRIYQSEQSTSGVPFLRISDLVNKMDTGMLSAGLFILEKRYEELKEQKLVPSVGDILVTARGTLGRCYIIEKNDKFYFQDGMITWLSKFDKEVTSLYISYLFSMQGIKKQIDGMQAGSTVAYLSIAMTKKLDIMLPPLELQNEFADFIKQVDKSKVAVQKSIDEAQLLFDSLMQKYFE